MLLGQLNIRTSLREVKGFDSLFFCYPCRTPTSLGLSDDSEWRSWIYNPDAWLQSLCHFPALMLTWDYPFLWRSWKSEGSKRTYWVAGRAAFSFKMWHRWFPQSTIINLMIKKATLHRWKSVVRNYFLLDIPPALLSLASHVALSLCLLAWATEFLHPGHQHL